MLAHEVHCLMLDQTHAGCWNRWAAVCLKKVLSTVKYLDYPADRAEFDNIRIPACAAADDSLIFKCSAHKASPDNSNTLLHHFPCTQSWISFFFVCVLVKYAKKYPHIHCCVCVKVTSSRLERMRRTVTTPQFIIPVLWLCVPLHGEIGLSLREMDWALKECVKCGRRAAVPQSDASGMTDLSRYLLAFHSGSVCLLMPLTLRSKAAETSFL